MSGTKDKSKIGWLARSNVWPVVQRELREGSRRPATRRLRLISASVGTLLLWFIVGKLTLPTAMLGGFLLGSLHRFLLGLILFVVPALTADCIAREKRDGTLGLLFLTPLSAGGIVAGKTLAQGLRAFTLWLAVVPILTIPFMTGGVTWFGAINALCLEFCAMVLCLAAGLFASSLAKNRNVAFLLAFAMAVSLLVVFVQVSELVLISGGPAFATTGEIAWFLFGMIYLNFSGGAPLGLTSSALHEYLKGLCFIGPPVSLLILYLVGSFAAWRVARSWQDKIPSLRRESFFRRNSKPWPLRRVQQRRILNWNPIAWLQQYSWKARVSKWGLFLLFVFIELTALISGNWHTFNQIQNLLLLTLIGVCTFIGVSGFLEEKRNGALELLLVTPISPGKLIFGRAWGLWKLFAPASLILGVCIIWDACRPDTPAKWESGPTVWGWTSDDNGFSVALHAIVVIGCGFLALPIFATYFALRVKNLIVATILTGIAVFVPFAFAASASGLLRDDTQDIPVLAVFTYGGFALLTCFMLRHSLSRRIYSF